MSQFEEFCERSSLHGWLYFFHSRHKCWKAIWIVIVFLYFACSVFLVFQAAMQYSNATVITVIETLNAPLSKVTFPSLTLCNLNQVNVCRTFFFLFVNRLISDTKIVSIFIKLDWSGTSRQVEKADAQSFFLQNQSLRHSRLLKLAAGS